MEGSLTTSTKLQSWLHYNKQVLFLDVTSKGCNGETIFFQVRKRVEKTHNNVTISSRLNDLIRNGLKIEVDYIDEPLFKRVHINILNKDKCGCGTSFNL